MLRNPSGNLLSDITNSDARFHSPFSDRMYGLTSLDITNPSLVLCIRNMNSRNRLIINSCLLSSLRFLSLSLGIRRRVTPVMSVLVTIVMADRRFATSRFRKSPFISNRSTRHAISFGDTYLSRRKEGILSILSPVLTCAKISSDGLLPTFWCIMFPSGSGSISYFSATKCILWYSKSIQIKSAKAS